jgi:hypothetical protein
MNQEAIHCSQILNNMQDAWNAAAKVWNPNTLAQLYAENALFYGGRPGHSIGATEIQKYFASYQGLIESAVLDLIEQELVQTGSDCFIAQGFGSFAFMLSGGRATKSVMRTTLVLKQIGGIWKIQLHHFSVTPEVPPLGDT